MKEHLSSKLIRSVGVERGSVFPAGVNCLCASASHDLHSDLWFVHFILLLWVDLNEAERQFSLQVWVFLILVSEGCVHGTGLLTAPVWLQGSGCWQKLEHVTQRPVRAGSVLPAACGSETSHSQEQKRTVSYNSITRPPNRWTTNSAGFVLTEFNSLQ